MLFAIFTGTVIGTLSSLWIQKTCHISPYKTPKLFHSCKSCTKWYVRFPVTRWFVCHNRCMDPIPFFCNEFFHILSFCILSGYSLPTGLRLLYMAFLSVNITLASIDYHTRTLPLYMVCLNALFCILLTKQTLTAVPFSLLVILPVWLISLYKDCIGTGDILVLLSYAILFPIPRFFVLLGLSCLFCGIFILWQHKRNEEHSSFPFLPSLVLAMEIVLFV
ncbi:MAG: hypothetical protein HUJ58_09535 [Erysipelotrichaceae bacterium]|nr:hypothetical protein [Erysipelotrichaceae bacterium]